MAIPLQEARYSSADKFNLAEGWTVERLTPPSRLFGANGLRTGPDGRVYIAQVTGSQISALDTRSGRLGTISAKGSEIVAPDDIAFDSAGNLYVTEVLNGRVSMIDTAGRTRVLCDDIPVANGITIYRDRLFVNECRPGGRVLELDLEGGEPRILLENVPMANAMEVGPDGLLYFPVMGANEIWRISPDGGSPETVVGDLGVPDSVKFDADGHIVSTQAHSGQVLRIDPRTGIKSVLADLSPGLDNLTFAEDRLFVSNFSGEIYEVLDGGRARTMLPGGFNWPLDLTIASDGNLYIADGPYMYVLRADHTLRHVGMLFTPGYPGYMRGLTESGPGEFTVTTSSGQVARYCPGRNESHVVADGFDQLYGVAMALGGETLFVEQGTGRVLSTKSGGVEVLASELDTPVGVTLAPDGSPLVAESGTGRVLKITGSKAEPVADEMQCPHGIHVEGRHLYIVDAEAKTLVVVDLENGAKYSIASNLPVGAPPGVVPKPLLAMPPFTGPQGPFAGITAAHDGTLFVSADAEGSVLAFRRNDSRATFGGR
ncbi:gluconolactonase [Mycolicibacterium flavescens]|uniref:SMP-30/gluconolactonase/LRE family protein n=1 Tax=Mycobacterium neumannii TaxID=2048551 RepID=UPI000B943108|nr:SMP-30/gluconolactonase/LRE family protein [Mycobacterium neumannii]VEG43647.1 gluconolactonase [Mycolicibacterium flavescens]